MKYTDAQEVIVLAGNILKDTKNIVDILSDLDSELKSLEGTFFDDGIETVKSFVKGFNAKTSTAVESANTVASQLLDYADLLIKGK